MLKPILINAEESEAEQDRVAADQQSLHNKDKGDEDKYTFEKAKKLFPYAADSEKDRDHQKKRNQIQRITVYLNGRKSSYAYAVQNDDPAFCCGIQGGYRVFLNSAKFFSEHMLTPYKSRYHLFHRSGGKDSICLLVSGLCGF